MALTNAQQSEVIYLQHRISLNEDKLQKVTAHSQALLPKLDTEDGKREFLIQGENFKKLKDEIEEWQNKITGLEKLK